MIVVNTDKTVVCQLCEEEVHCKTGNVIYDALLPYHGRWAWLCVVCLVKCGAELGTGKGQEFRCRAGKWAKAAG